MLPRRQFLQAGFGAVAWTLAGPSGLRAQGARRPVSVDVHTHWLPEAYVKAMSDLGRPTSSLGTPPDPRSVSLDKRLAWMDAHGIQMHVLTLSGSMPWQWAPQDVAMKLARIVNDAAVQAHQQYPTRLVAAVSMPIRDPVQALQELNRMAGKPGICAVHLPNSIEGRDYLFEPAYAPILARAEELGYPLLFHPLDGVANQYAGPDRLGGSAFLYNSLGFPFEHATTAVKFIYSGTLDRYPKLDIVLPHAGGAFPFIAGRIDHSLQKGAAKGVTLQKPFREYIRRFHYDTLTYYPETLRYLVQVAGADRVVIGTDNYAIMDVEEPNALVEQLHLPAADEERILRGNAARLFRLSL